MPGLAPNPAPDLDRPTPPPSPPARHFSDVGRYGHPVIPLPLGTVVAASVPPALTWTRVLTSWRAQPGVLLSVLALAASYALALRHRRTRGERWPSARSAYFAAGVISLALAGLSFLGVYDDTLFWVRAAQNAVLLMVTPMLLALGAPITLIRDCLPPGARGVLSRLLHSAPARALTFPLVITVALVLPLPILYFSPLYELTLRNATISGISGLMVALTGFVYFWTRFRIDPTPRADPYGVTLVITIIEMIGDAVLGVVVWLGPLIAAGYYTALSRGWGPSPRTDQTLGAGVLWVVGDAVGLPFIAVVFHLMAREDQHRAALLDAALDAAEAAPDNRGAAAAGAANTGDQHEQPGVGHLEGDEHNSRRPAPRLWWEDHPELSERFRRR
jgi:cytochrome c oxidase assembly factor CtaG